MKEGRLLDSGAGDIFANSAREYSRSYSTVTPAYTLTEREMCLIMTQYLLTHQNPNGIPLKVLEVGAGTGQSSKRIEERLKKAGVLNYKLVTSEKTAEMTEESKKIDHEEKESGEKSSVIVPQLLMKADDMCFPDNHFNVVYGGMVIHWADPKKVFKETHRVLLPGGLAVFSSSGMLKSGPLNFIEHPFYKYYVEKVHEILVEKGYWDDEKDGKFVQKSEKVSPVLDQFSPDDIKEMIEDTGFTDIEVCMQLLPVDKADMLARMRPGAASMYLFGGEYAKKISEKERTNIANEAVRRTQEEIPEQLDELDINPTIEHLPVFSGLKPTAQ